MNDADRRSSCRYSAVLTQGWLGWWEGQAFRNTNAQVVDISLRGCMMTVDQLPPEDQPVWFCPPGTTPSEWIEATLIESRRRLLGPRVVRIAFRSAIPYETFKTLVYGPDAIGGPTPESGWVPEEERDFW
jgi:hypothetical protein